MNGILFEKVTSFTKPEIYNILHCRHSLEEGRVTATVVYTENFVKFGHVVFDICE